MSAASLADAEAALALLMGCVAVCKGALPLSTAVPLPLSDRAGVRGVMGLSLIVVKEDLMISLSIEWAFLCHTLP
jgi:hypothetical protein